MTDWLGLPALGSAHGAAIDHTMGLVHWLMFLLFVGWGAFFTFVLFRFRKARNPVADYAGVHSKTSTYLEIAVAVAEAVLLIGFSIPLWAQRVAEFPPEATSYVVHATAEQFAWNFHYPGPDGVFGRTDITKIDVADNPLGLDRDDPAAKDDITTINQLHVPANRPVIIKLRSKDVIHSFNVPELRVKQDAVPGLTIPLWFVANVTTDEMRQKLGKPEFQYEIACAQLCGLGHYRMRGFVNIDTDEQLKTWTDAEEAKLAESGDDTWN